MFNTITISIFFSDIIIADVCYGTMIVVVFVNRDSNFDDVNGTLVISFFLLMSQWLLLLISIFLEKLWKEIAAISLPYEK